MGIHHLVRLAEYTLLWASDSGRVAVKAPVCLVEDFLGIQAGVVDCWSAPTWRVTYFGMLFVSFSVGPVVSCPAVMPVCQDKSQGISDPS